MVMMVKEPVDSTGVGETGQSCVRVQVHEYRAGAFDCRPAAVVQEIEVGVRVKGGQAYEVNCSPWSVRECVVGSLFFRGVIATADDVVSYEFDRVTCTVTVDVRTSGQATDARSVRGCGSLQQVTAPGLLGDTVLTADEVNALIGLLEDGSHLFHRTGGVHSAAVATKVGVLCRQEDVSRQAALDKLMGSCLLENIDAAGTVMLFSGRMPYSIVSRVAMMGCPVVISPGAPTDLSIELAERCGITLVGFAKNGCFNAYTHAQRIVATGAWSRKVG